MQNYRQLADDFKRLAKSNKLSHAYLFFGGDEKNHQEKFLFAQSLANFLENGIFNELPRLLQEILIISPDEKGTIGIDSIRDLKYFLWQKPTNSTRRVAVIKEAENLTPEAQNAALKIVEEPPESALIIFISNIEDNLFPALTSRLQKIYFSSVAESDAVRINPVRNDISTGVNADYGDLPARHRPARPPASSLAGEVWRESKAMAGGRGYIEEIIENNQIDQFFRSLISDFKKEPIKNSKKLKAALNRLVLMKQFNINKRLQLKALISSISK